ncbi:hypothetical protein HYV12_00940 [Candidatus Dojkabacteria bacterium]|nr:hypothetical protein [Candidatus Dojkabacteria bacterium]
MKKIVPLILALTLFGFYFSTPVSALGEASLSLGFAPTSIYLDLKPGETFKDELTFWNLAPSTITYEVRIRGFKQIEDIPGTSRIQTDFEEKNDPYSASSWITVEKESVQLHPNEYFTLPYTIKVPKDVAVGEFNAIIFLQSKSGINPLSRSSAALADLGSGPAILINTGDDIKELASLEYFKTDKNFYEYTPVNFLTRYLNTGNTHITPAGDIILENFLGQEVDRIPFNPNKQSLLRSNSAVYENTWEDKGIFFKNGKIAVGPIKAKLITTYRAKFPGFAPLSATTTFWIIPWKVILAILFTITLIIYLISRRKIKHNGQDTHITYINNPALDNDNQQRYPTNSY